jgi:hypothetical protein
MAYTKRLEKVQTAVQIPEASTFDKVVYAEDDDIVAYLSGNSVNQQEQQES